MQTPHQQGSEARQRRKAGAIAGCLTQCLHHLDSIDARLAAVHVSMALDILKREYRLDCED